MVKASRECFSRNLFEMISVLSDKELGDIIIGFMYYVKNTGYGISKEYYKYWRVWRVKPNRVKMRLKHSMSKPGILAKFAWLFPRSLDFYYYDDPNYVNVFTTAEEDLPLYINHSWPDINDRILYEKRMKNINLKRKVPKEPDELKLKSIINEVGHEIFCNSKS